MDHASAPPEGAHRRIGIRGVVVILSVPFHRIPQVADLLADVPAETVVIDTSNYYPSRDDNTDAHFVERHGELRAF